MSVIAMRQIGLKTVRETGKEDKTDREGSARVAVRVRKRHIEKEREQTVE